jgi:hypothetical protein
MVSTHIHAMDSEGQRGDGKQRMDRDWFGSKSNWIAIGFVFFLAFPHSFSDLKLFAPLKGWVPHSFFQSVNPNGRTTWNCITYCMLRLPLLYHWRGPITGMIEVVSVLFSVSCCTVSENIQMLVALCGDGENGMHAVQVDFADLQVQIA